MVARRCALLAVLVTAMVGVVPPVASAAGSTTKIIVSLKFPAFHGTVASNKTACKTDRTVKLFRERSGPDKLLGTDKSDAKAKWSIPLGKRLTSGAYYAKAPAKGNCKSAKSKVLTID